MDWKNCNIQIDKDSTDLYHTFRSMGVISHSVLVALELPKNKVIYEVLVLNDERNVGIIGGNELYCYHKDTIVGYCPIEEIPKSWLNLSSNNMKKDTTDTFKGVIYQNGTMLKGYNNADKLFDDYDALMDILITNNGKPVFEESDEKEGTAVFYNVSTYKPSSISFKTNR